MLNKEALPNTKLRNVFQKFEILEISALIGTGGFAVLQGELLPTVMAVGALAGIAAWHTIHVWKDRKSNQTALTLSDVVEQPTQISPSDNTAESVRETLDAIHEGDLFPSIKAPSKHARRRIKKRLGRTSPRHS